MSINIELALVLGLFIIGALALALDNHVETLHRRWIRSFLQRKSVVAEAQSLQLEKKKPSDHGRLLKRDLTDGF